MKNFIYNDKAKYPYTLRKGKTLRYHIPDIKTPDYIAYSLKGEKLIEKKGEYLYIYEGYACDGCTAVPDCMQCEDTVISAFLHDAKYQVNHHRKWTRLMMSRREVDLAFKRLLPWYYMHLFYVAVRAAGSFFFNRKEKSLNIEIK